MHMKRENQRPPPTRTSEPARDLALRPGAELRKDAGVVVQSPVLYYDSIREVVEDHRPELDALARGSDPLELPFMRPLVAHVVRHPVVLGRQASRSSCGSPGTPSATGGMRDSESHGN